MPRYLIQRTLGNISEDELEAAAETSSRVREEQFPEIEWEHSHVVRTDHGLTAYCIYAAPTAQRLREHAAASGLPADDVQEIHRDLQPQIRRSDDPDRRAASAINNEPRQP